MQCILIKTISNCSQHTYNTPYYKVALLSATYNAVFKCLHTVLYWLNTKVYLNAEATLTCKVAPPVDILGVWTK